MVDNPLTAEVAAAKLQMWLDADAAVAGGQSYEIDVSGTRRKLTRADGALIAGRINYWSTMLNRLNHHGSASPTVRLMQPRDR